MSSGRRNIMLGTAGHVDHGKTALVKLLTGCETDTLAEEKQRGLTIDLGFAPCRLADDRIVGVVDVPGHVDFIRNMVAGAHGVDVVILVVAADDGIMPQTREHLHILTLMGLRYGLVALTKIDLVEPSRRQEVADDLRRLLVGTFLADAPICPVSNVTGEGFDGFFESLNAVVTACGERPCTGPFRLWVEDVFTIRGPGTVVTGIPSSGMVRAGETLTLLPAGRAARVRRMQVYGQDATEARAGECVALNVPEIDHVEAKRGMVLTASDSLQPVSIVEAELSVLATVTSTLEDSLEAHLHIGTASVLARVAMLETDEMSAGQKQMVQFHLAEPLPLVPGERFVLRANVASQGQSGLFTVGGGRILGVGNLRLRRRKQWTLDTLAARRDALEDPARWCEQMLREAGTPLPTPVLLRLSRLRQEELAPLLQRLQSEGCILTTTTGGWVHAANVKAAADKMLAALDAFHAANPQRAGMAGEELNAAAGDNAELCELAVNSLVRAAQVERQGTVFARAGRKARLTDPDQRLCEDISAAFQAAGWAGPATGDLAVSLRQPLPRIEKMVNLLVERGQLVRLDKAICIHREALAAAQDVVLRLFSRRPSFSTMEFRDAVGVSRKYAVPLLDYLDKLRFTVRSGHDRTPGVEARKRMSVS